MRNESDNNRESAGPASGLSRSHARDNPPQSRRSALGRHLVLAMTSIALLAGGGDDASAQVSIEGRADAVRVDASDATVQEVLDALRAKFNLRYRTSDVLDSHITGSFNGPLDRVAARILDGYDFAMKVTPEDVDVLVLRQNATDSGSVVPAMPASANPERSPASVMTAAQANRYERKRYR
jgi:hypothetical protein